MKTKNLISVVFAVALLLATNVTAVIGLTDNSWVTSEMIEQAIKEDEERQMIIDRKPIYSIQEDGSLVLEDARVNRNELLSLKATTSGTYPRGSKKKGTVLYTKDTKIKIMGVVGHAAIVADNKENDSKVVESTISGVVYGPNTWNTKSHCRAAVVSSLSVAKRAAVADKCAGWLNKPYNTDYTNTSTRKKFYCSQLVWAGYWDKYSVNIDDNAFNGNTNIVYPSELISSSKTKLVYSKG